MNIEDNIIKKELIYFKEDVLKDIRLEMSKLINKIDSQKESFDHTILALESKMGTITEKFINLSNSINEDKTLKEKVSKLCAFQIKTQDTLSFHDSKFNNQSKLIIETMDKMDRFINESILYNDIIGPKPNCKFQNFHSFIDYIILNITQLNNFKEKTNLIDFKSFKSKIEAMIETLRVQITNSSKANNNYAKNLVEKEEEDVKDLFKAYDEKIFELKIENCKYIEDIKIIFENMQKEWEKIFLIKNDVYEKIEKEKEEINNTNKCLESKLKEYQMNYTVQNGKLNKNIDEIFDLIKALKISQNKNYIEIKENKTFETKENKKFERKEETKEQEKENKKEEIKEDKKEDKGKKEEIKGKIEKIKLNERNEKEEKKNEKREETESLLKQYIEGKVDYEQISNYKMHKKNKSIEERNSRNNKLNYVEYNTNEIKNTKTNYFEIFNNFINNPRIKSIYNSNDKSIQNFIDKIIIRSAINSQIKDNENLNQIIFNNLKDKEQLRISEKENNKNQNFQINENLKLDEHSIKSNKGIINSSKNINLNDLIFNSIKENLLNNYNNKNNFQKNLEINNKKTSISLIKKKNNLLNSQLSFLNNDLGEEHKNLQPSLSLQKISLTKKFNASNYLKRNVSLDFGKNFTSVNNNIEGIHKKTNFKKINKDYNNNIINYSNKNKSQRFNLNKNKFQTDASISNCFENKYENLKYKKNILIKNDKNNIKNNFESRNLTNKISNNNLTLNEPGFNNRYLKHKFEIIAVNQIENCIKNLENQEK